MKSVLIVDDNDIDRELVRRYLGSSYELTESATATEALEQLASAPTDCVLLDYRLPDRSGIEIIADFVQQGVPVIMLTGQGDEQVVVRALKAGACDYLAKAGLSADLLRRTIETAMREATHLREKTELVQERDAVSAIRDEFQALLESTPDFVSILDPEGYCRYVNPAGRTLTGLSESELIGQHVSVMHSEKEGHRIMDSIIPLALEQGGSWSGEIVFRDPADKPIPADAVVVAKTDAQGMLRFVAIIARDTRDRERLEAQLRQGQKMEALGRLAGGIAHDFNNMLTVVFSFTDFAIESLQEGHPAKDDLEEVLRAARRAKDLTQQLLSFSRKRTVEPVLFDPNHRVREAKRMLSRLLGEDILIEVNTHAKGNVRIDPGALEQVLVNLAVNARDAMPKGGTLTIETRTLRFDEGDSQNGRARLPAGDYVAICMHDTGVGMDEETLRHIFEPFFTTKKVNEGTGLGLATVYGIVSQAGGDLHVTSQLGKGSTFEIYLPCFSAGRPRATSIAQPSLPTPGNERILLVEDDEQIRRIAKRTLEKEGYAVTVAADGSQALELVGERPLHFDMLVTDVVMPGTTGKQVADALRRQQPDLKVLYISGYTQDIIARHGIVEEGLDLLQKPFSPRELISRVRRILDTNGDTSS